jgi:CRP-like cAMP-binding protein
MQLQKSGRVLETCFTAFSREKNQESVPRSHFAFLYASNFISRLTHPGRRRRVPLFAGAKETLLRTLAVELRFECFPAGACVFRRGRVGEKVYFVIGGRVELRSRLRRQEADGGDDGDDSDDDNAELRRVDRPERSSSGSSDSIARHAESFVTRPDDADAAASTTSTAATTTIVGSGAMFGERELLRAARRACTARALDSLQLLSLSGAACRRVLARFPDFEQRVVRATTAAAR